MTAPPAIGAFVAKYFSRGLLVDTNLLLLYLTGRFDRRLIGTFKRTQHYTPEDFDLLAGFIARFRWTFITPHILAEVSNLAQGIKGPQRSGFLRTFVQALTPAKEHWIAKNTILSSPLFVMLGATDTGFILGAPQPEFLVLTDDFRAAHALETARRAVINFNHLRQLNWLARP